MPFYRWIGRQRKGYAYISKPRSCKDICNARQVYAPTPIRRSRARPAGQFFASIYGPCSPLPRLGLPKALPLDLLLAFLSRTAGLLAIGPGRRQLGYVGLSFC